MCSAILCSQVGLVYIITAQLTAGCRVQQPSESPIAPRVAAKMASRTSFQPGTAKTPQGQKLLLRFPHLILTSTKTKTKATKPKKSQPAIHPLFRKDQFMGNIDYNTAFRAPAILATRLLNTPQAKHWVYALLFGKNAPAALPAGIIPEGATRPPGGIGEIPDKYACNKGIHQLNPEDIAEVDQALADLAHRCHFDIKDYMANPGTLGETCATDINCEYSIISIQGASYQRALKRDTRSKAANALVDLGIASTMLHEIGHTLNVHKLRDHAEGFFEEALVAEHGFELESRIFGMCPHISPGNITEWSYWFSWQTRDFLQNGYDLTKLCRNLWKLPKKTPTFTIGTRFALKLSSDSFWEEEYVQKGALAVVPDIVQQLCREGMNDTATRGIPPSIKDLFTSNARSYAERKYPGFANPRRYLRDVPSTPEGWFSNDEGGEDEESDGDESEAEAEAEWSEGEDTEADGYMTADMTDGEDDDATVRGDESDDDMTEVEVWKHFRLAILR